MHSLNVNKSTKWIKLPYLPGIYEECKKVCSSKMVRLVPTLSHQVGGMFQNTSRNKMRKEKEEREKNPPKEKNAQLSCSGIVYGIPCSDCKGIYIGQTGRPLMDRLKEHKRAIKKGDCQNACAKHVTQQGHTMNFNDVRIVHKEKNTSTRLALEAFTIAANKTRLLNISPPLASMQKWVDLLNTFSEV